MPWIVSGSCSHCGICCLSIALGGCMLENPCISLGEDRCKFYTDDVDTSTQHGHCRIKQARENYDRVRDRFGKRMTDAQIVWYEHNCRQFPLVVDFMPEEHGGAGAKLPSTCSYMVERAEP